MTVVARKGAITSQALKALQATKKTDSIVVGPITRHLLAKPPHEGRDTMHIHPSEMAKDTWCHRATYYRIAAGQDAVSVETNPSFVLETIFAEGHQIHAKWQGWLWDIGELEGIFKCLVCEHEWWAVSPDQCTAFDCPAWLADASSRKTLAYKEVPLYNEEHLIIGHSDGLLSSSEALLEVKSVGIGTLRFEAPALLQKHTYESEDAGKTLMDYEGIWRDIKRPFNSHLRQGMMYCFLSGKSRIVFLYECKWNQQSREFVIRYTPKFVEPLLEACLDIKYALRKGKPPPCPNGGCAECRAYEDGESNGDKDSPTKRKVVRRTGGPDAGTGGGRRKRTGTAGAGRARAASGARARDSADPERPDRADRRPVDGVVRHPHSLGGLLERATGDL